MNSGFALFLAFGIGVVAGLRSMTAPAIVAWAAHLGWISLSGLGSRNLYSWRTGRIRC